MNIPNPGKFGKVLQNPTEGAEGSCSKAPLPMFESAPGDNTSGSSIATSTSTSQTNTNTKTSTNLNTNTTPAVTLSNGCTQPPVPVATSFGQREPCSKPDGTIQCFADGTWGICVYGEVQHQLVPAGMKCEDGAIKAANSLSL